MKTEEIDALEAGELLNALVADLIMGCYAEKKEDETWDLIIPGDVNRVDFVEQAGALQMMRHIPYSTDMAYGWKVFMRMKEYPWSKRKRFIDHLHRYAGDAFDKTGAVLIAWPDALWFVNADMICRAALKATVKD